MDCRLYRKGMTSVTRWVMAAACWLFAVSAYSHTANHHQVTPIAQQQVTNQQASPNARQQATLSQQTSPNWRDSLKVLNRLIATTAWSSDLHLRKAAVNIELNQWEYAIEEYSQVLQHEPKNIAALFYRAYANSHLRRYDLSRRDYEDVLRQVPTNMEARLGLAYVLQQSKHHVEALDQLNQTVDAHPDSAVAYAARASLERELKQYDAALYDWDEAISRKPLNVDYVVSKVEILLALYRQEEARKVLDAAVSRGISRGLLREWYRKCR